MQTMSKMTSSQAGTGYAKQQGVLGELYKLKNEFPGMSKEMKTRITELEASFKFDGANINVDKAMGQIRELRNELMQTADASKNLWASIKDKAFYGLAAQIGGMFSFYDAINAIRSGIDAITELDTSLVDLKKTTSMTSSELNNFYYDANNVAKQMGVTTNEIIEQASAWSRLGYSTKDQAETMAQLSSQFASISPGMDTDSAQEGLVSIMKAWDIDTGEVKSEIMDKINILGNSFAESNEDIVEGMKRSASALSAVGTSYEDAFALFTGAQEILQSSEVAGRALRSISMRVRGYSETSEDGDLQVDDELKNIKGDLIDLTKTAEHTQGVSIFKPGSTTEFKSLVEYFGEIHDIWDEMSQKQQNDYLQKAFGKTQAQAGSAIIKNYDAIKDALAAMDESAGSSDKEMATIESSIEYKLNRLKETWVGTAQEVGNRSVIGGAIDSLTSISELIQNIIKRLGVITPLVTTFLGTLSAKGVGKHSKCNCISLKMHDSMYNLCQI